MKYKDQAGSEPLSLLILTQLLQYSLWILVDTYNVQYLINVLHINLILE